MRRTKTNAIVSTVLALTAVGATQGPGSRPDRTRILSAMPIIEWSTEARRAIVPPGPGGIFGTENYGNKFPGEAAIYMGIVHAAMYDAAVAIEGRYRPYAIALTAPVDTSPEAAIATAAHHVLVDLDLDLKPDQRKILEDRYQSYLDALPDDQARANGKAVGEHVAFAILRLRDHDGRERHPTLDDLEPPPPGPGVWDPGAAPAVGLRVPGIRPLALERGSQFQPDGPSPLRSSEYADDFEQVEKFGSVDSTARSFDETTTARFWTDHDVRQWNDGMLRLAHARGLGLVETARMLAMAHVAGADAMIACFDAKYTYWFWRPYQAIPKADTDGNPNTHANTLWQPLGTTTPNFPEYPSAHACHTSALAESLRSFFGTDRVPFSLDSRVVGMVREYDRFDDVIKEVNRARVLIGFHFRNSDQEGSILGRRVARYVTKHFFGRLSW
jgi:hypothetical protein